MMIPLGAVEELCAYWGDKEKYFAFSIIMRMKKGSRMSSEFNILLWTRSEVGLILRDMIGSPKQWLFKSEEGLILKDMIGRLNKRKDTIGQAIHLTQNGH